MAIMAMLWINKDFVTIRFGSVTVKLVSIGLPQFAAFSKLLRQKPVKGRATEPHFGDRMNKTCFYRRQFGALPQNDSFSIVFF